MLDLEWYEWVLIAVAIYVIAGLVLAYRGRFKGGKAREFLADIVILPGLLLFVKVCEFVVGPCISMLMLRIRNPWP